MLQLNYGTLEYIKGDLDRNNVVDANDASVALELYKAQNATAQDIQIGDMDNNSLIDANDASLILEHFKTHQQQSKEANNMPLYFIILSF